MRILFISGEVAPFTSTSEMAQIVRKLPEHLHEKGEYETRIMMPRYGTVNERRNRLHEVIRLSGTRIPMGAEAETLKVKVASIPGIRLQVYFMDNNHFFKRKGIFTDKQGELFTDNTERALFFGRSVIETIRNLGWGPVIIHAFGWMSGFVPMLLRTTYAEDALFQETKIIYTPENVGFESSFSSDDAATLGLPNNGHVIDRAPTEIGQSYADLVLYPPSMTSLDSTCQLSADTDELVEQAMSHYEQVLQGVPA